MVQYVFALDWWIGIGWLSSHESPTKGEYFFPHDALLKDPAQTMGLNASECTPSEQSLGSSVKGRGGPGGARDIVKAKSSGEDSRATGGLVSNLSHFQINKTNQQTFVLSVELETAFLVLFVCLFG